MASHMSSPTLTACSKSTSATGVYGTKIDEPEEETVFDGTGIKSVEIFIGMKPDTHQNA